MKTALMGILILLVSACGDADFGLFNSGAYLSLPANASLYESFDIRVAGLRGQVESWEFTDEFGAALDAPCPAVGGPALYNCVSETAGQLTIQASVRLPDGSLTNVSGAVDIVDPNFERNQAPQIVLDITDFLSAEEVATIATFREFERGAVTVSADQALRFSFARTRDAQDDVSMLTFEVDTGSGFQITTSDSQVTFEETGVYPIKLRVTDSEGNAAEKTFLAYVACNTDGMDPLMIDVGQIEITPGAIHNFFTYDATGAVSGGQGPYEYKWDFNGNGIFDPISQEEEWTESPSVEAYTIHGGVREVQLKVWDSCNNIATQTISQQFDIPSNDVISPDGIPGTLQGPQVPGYYFLHANLRGTNGNLSKPANTDYMASLKLGEVYETKPVECDYRRVESDDPTDHGSWGILTIKGQHQYDSPYGDGTKHGMELLITDIYDTIGTRDPALDNKEPSIFRAYYYTDQGGDIADRLTYRKTQDCELDFVFTPQTPTLTQCADGASEYAYQARFDATFSCPDMESDTGLTLRATQGALFCEIQITDGCPGGGGGGGGGTPPIPQ